MKQGLLLALEQSRLAFTPSKNSSMSNPSFEAKVKIFMTVGLGKCRLVGETRLLL